MLVHVELVYVQAICSAYTSEIYSSNDLTMLENVKDAILRMTYYWYLENDT